MRNTILCLPLMLATLSGVSSFAFVARKSLQGRHATSNKSIRETSTTSLSMVDQNVLVGAGIAVSGLVAGIGLVAFTEQQGERAKERGGGLSEDMTTRIAGKLLEDVEVSSVSDIGSLTSQLEKALRETGAAKDEQFEMTEDDKKRIQEEADDGW